MTGSNDPEDLQREIEATRADLADTFDQIADRVSPRRVAQRNVERAKGMTPAQVATVAAPVVAVVALLVWRRRAKRARAGRAALRPRW